MRNVHFLAFAVAAVCITSLYANVPAPTGECAGDVTKPWLDIIFLVDSSSAMSQYGLFDVSVFVQSAILQFDFDDTHQKYARVGVLPYADDVDLTYDFPKVIADTLVNMKLKYYGTPQTNLEKAFKAAMTSFGGANQKDNRKQVIVIIASAYRDGNYEDPTQIVSEFKQNGGVVITLEYQQPFSGPVPKLKGLASPGFGFSNADDGGFSPADLLNALGHANCFCKSEEQPLSSTDYGSPDLGCASTVALEINEEFAANDCTAKIGKLPHIQDDTLETVIANLFTPATSVWLPYTRDDGNGDYHDDDDAKTAITYHPWTTPPDNDDTKKCAVTNNKQWTSVSCDETHRFACIAVPCSLQTNCFATAT